MPSELQSELRNLWKKYRPALSDDLLDVYFSETYNPANLCTSRNEAGEMTACCQMLMRRMTFFDHSISIGILTALAIDTNLKAAERKEAARNVIARQHQRMAQKGALISMAFPADNEERQLLESCGYHTASHIIEADPQVPETSTTDDSLTVAEETEWGRDIWTFYNRNGGGHDFEMKMDEGDFFALIAQNDAAGGCLIVARRRGRIAGLALARREGKPLKSGKPSSKIFRTRIPFILAIQEDIFYALLRYAGSTHNDCKQTVVSTACPLKGFEGSRPYAMARAIRAEEFLAEMARITPGLQLEIGIGNDEDLPENNGSYRLRNGRCYSNATCSSSTTTPGGIPAIFMAGHPTVIPPVFLWE